jgi:single-strand DNA-binding protein
VARSGSDVTIKGNNVIDVLLKYANSGTAMLKLRVATERWRKQGESWEKTNTSFFDIQIWGDLAEHTAGIVEKGQRVIVTGYLEERNWEDKNTGEKRYKTQIVANEISIPVEDIESMERIKRGEAAKDAAAAPIPPKVATGNDPFDEELDF